MKYLIYSTLLLALVSRADDLLPEGTQVEAAPQLESKSEEPALAEPVAPASSAPSLALPVESPVATATAVTVSTATEVAPVAAEAPKATEEASKEGPVKTAHELSGAPVDETALQLVPPSVAAPVVNYGPSAEEGYGSVGLKNEGQFMEVGGDKRTEESPTEGDRKTSSLPEDLTSLP